MIKSVDQEEQKHQKIGPVRTAPQQEERDEKKRKWVRIEHHDMLKLEIACNLGLPAYFAAKIVLGVTQNASRLLRGLSDLRDKKAQTLSTDDLQQWKNDEKSLKRGFKLEVLLKVSQARQQGLISMKNMIKMDEKINSQAVKYA